MSISVPYLDPMRKTVFQLAAMAFQEDMPEGDITVEALQLERFPCKGYVKTRESLVMAGVAWGDQVVEAFRALHPEAQLKLHFNVEDGQPVDPGATLCTVEAPADEVLAFERTFLNFLSRSLGIAKQTATLVRMLEQARVGTRILDTRKTQPGYRLFDKYSVRCGGGWNHRLNLSDQVLIKENHIAKHDGVAEVLQFVKRNLKRPVPIIIEVQNFDECRAAIEEGCDVIMLDNFSPEQVREACTFKPNTIEFEVSGGITSQNILEYCHAGIDRISIGAITHSVKAPDITLLVEEELNRDHCN